MASDHYTTRVANKLLNETMSHAEQIAQSMAWPSTTSDTRTLPRSQYVDMFQQMSVQDPMFLQTTLDEDAPAGIPMPDGSRMRPITGLLAFIEKVRVARPDIYLQVMSQQEAGDGR